MIARGRGKWHARGQKTAPTDAIVDRVWESRATNGVGPSDIISRVREKRENVPASL